MKADGIIIQQVNYLPEDSINLIEKTLKQNGVTIYARINQQQEVKRNGFNILPISFLMFGNAFKGAKLMLENPLTAIDLPLKVIAWQDEQQKNYIAFNDAEYITERYGLSKAAVSIIDLKEIFLKIFR
jgi:uncharacterized protein (DUF302 family)